MQNLTVVQLIADIVDEFLNDGPKGGRRKLIKFVTDRPGHDRRYAIDCRKIEAELDWQPAESFETGLQKDYPLVFG